MGASNHEVRIYSVLSPSRLERFRHLLGKLHNPIPAWQNWQQDINDSKESLIRFRRACNEAWERLQLELLDEILAIENHREETPEGKDEQLKWHWIVRKLADTLAWQVIGIDNLWIARRLCKHPLGKAALSPVTNSNYQSAIKFAAQCRADNPDCLPVLSDITSFVHLGDVILRDPALHVIELKEGKVNDMLMERMESGKPVETIRQELQANHSPGVLSQFDRMMRQKKRMDDTETLLNVGQGRNQLGVHTVISEATYELDSYYDILADLFEKLKTSEWAIEHIDGCLFIGLYRGQFRHPSVFGQWLNGSNFDGPVVNYLDCITNSLATPPMLAPVIQNHVERLLTGEVVLQLGIDLEGLMATGRKLGLPMRWLDEKESKKIVDTFRRTGMLAQEIYTWNGHAIAIYENNEEKTMGAGILGRILFEAERPSSVLRMLTHKLPEPSCEY